MTVRVSLDTDADPAYGVAAADPVVAMPTANAAAAATPIGRQPMMR